MHVLWIKLIQYCSYQQCKSGPLRVLQFPLCIHVYAYMYIDVTVNARKLAEFLKLY